jgi:cytochrome c
MSTDLSKNKIAAAILLAGLIGMVSGKVTEFLYDGGPQHAGGHHEEVRGYKIDVPEVAAEGGAAVVATAADISALYASADVEAGKSYFEKKCTVCHNIDKGGANKVGPHLYGVMGRGIASVSDFNYSEAMKKHAAEEPKWTFPAMNAFQWAPRKAVPGTIMAYAGTPKDQERANLIAYLNSQSDSPMTLPTAADAPKVEAPAADPAKDSTKDEKPAAPKAETSKKAVSADSGNKGANADTKPADTDEPAAH